MNTWVKLRLLWLLALLWFPSTVIYNNRYCHIRLRDLHDAFPPQDPAAPSVGTPHNRGLTITLRHTTLGRTPLDE